MSERNNRRLLNKIAAHIVPGVREVLDALNAINDAIENNGVTDRKVIQARELLAEASEIFREAALESLKEAKEICTIKGLIKPGIPDEEEEEYDRGRP